MKDDQRSDTPAQDGQSVRPPDLRRRPRRLAVCGICRQPFGPDRKGTDDHVIPKGFLSKPVPSNLPTWLVCEPCQDQLDPAEERLRNLFARGPSHMPESVAEVYARSTRSSREVLVEKHDWVMNKQDIYEFSPIARAEQEDLDMVLRKMVGGLFYWRHGLLHPDAKMVVSGALSRDAFAYWTNIVQFEMKLEVQHLGQVSWVARSNADLSSGFWLFVMHHSVGVGVWAGEMAERPDLPQSCPFPVRLR